MALRHGHESAGPTLLLLFGPPAVGKTTVGQAIAKRTSFRLLHAHMIIDLLTEFFEFGTDPFDRLNWSFHRQILEDAAELGLKIILTLGWRFDVPEDEAIIREYISPFLEKRGRVYLVELIAPLDIRLERNRTENRRRAKKTDWATDEALETRNRAQRQDSRGDIPLAVPFFRLDNSSLSAYAAAETICRRFGLT